MPRRHKRRKQQKKSKARIRQPLQTKPQAGGARLGQLAIKIGGWILATCTVLGFVLWLPFYVADIRIEISSSSNPLQQSVPPSFSVVNEGVFAAYKAEFICYYSQTSILNRPDLNIGDNYNGPSPLAEVLHRNTPVNIKCLNIVGPFVKESDVELLVSFQPAYSWMRSYTCARFTLMQNAYGQPEWFRTPNLSLVSLFGYV